MFHVPEGTVLLSPKGPAVSLAQTLPWRYLLVVLTFIFSDIELSVQLV